MKLKNIEIKNFRSIENAEIDFSENRARILVGINESGKSNVLKAMALLSTSRPILTSDRRTESREEEEIKQSYVRFSFGLSDRDVETVLASVSKKFWGGGLDTPILQSGDITYTLKEFCRTRMAVYGVDLMDGTRKFNYYKLPQKFEIISDWKKFKPFDVPIIINKKDSQPLTIAIGTEFINTDLVSADESLFVAMTPDEVNSAIGLELIKILESELPECILWEYEEKNLLPVHVGLEEFQNNPDICVPLKNCFEHAGIFDPSETIRVARSQTRHQLINLFSKVAAKTTTYIQSVWSDYKNVTLEFQPDGNVILPIVKDKNIHFDFAQRSDGFKRFITFLLLVSSKVKTDKISNTLILIDEPEVGLHPAGARNLMRELLNIAEKNYVVYSTHSIFMIDKDKINRHVIVEKKDEITTVHLADKSKIADEEVIYRAIGFSFLEILKPVNFVFEGWRDKRLFEISRKAYLKEFKDDPVIAEFNTKIGLCHAEGVKDIKNLSSLIELSGRDLHVISDSDAIAKEHQKKYRDAKMHGTWKTYAEITGNPKHITGEDFVTNESIIKKTASLKKKYQGLPELTHDALSHGNGKLYSIESWLVPFIKPEEKQSVLHEVKGLLFDSLKDSEIEPAYKDVIRYLFTLGS